MKKIRNLMVVLLFWACSSENAPDCLQSTGDIVTQEFLVDDFSRISVHPDITLTVAKGPEYRVVVTAGAPLISEVKATVVDDQLVLTNENGCPFFRKYNTTKVLVYTPTLQEIRSASQYTVASQGVLEFPELDLFSEDFSEPSEITSGNFDLQIDTQQLRIVSNNIATFYITGFAENLNINFASGIGRFEGADLRVQKAFVYHRGTNKIIVNPQQSLLGELRSTGDLISKNRPEIVEVRQYYKGRLIFE